MHHMGKSLLELSVHCPKVLEKKRAVTKHLAFEQIKIKPFFNKEKKVSSNALCKETKKVVVSFYKSDNISHQATDKRDVVTTRDEQGKQKLQKRHL